MQAERKGWLWAIVIVAVTLRVIAALYMGDSVYDLPGIFDQISYDGLAQRVVAGHGFSFGTDWWPATRADEPTAHWSFTMTLYLAAIYKVFGYHPLVARLIQAVVAGILMPLLTFRLAAKVTDRSAALVAAAISAVYIYFFYYAAALMTETFYFLSILGTLNLAVTVAARPSPGHWIGLGLVAGCAVLFRQTFLLFLPFMLLWIFWAGQGRVKLRQFTIPLIVIGLMVLPWTVRNYLAFHQFVLLNTNAGYVFFWSNHPIHGTSFISLLGSGQPSYHDLIPPELLSLDEAALEKALMARGLEFVTADPGRYLLLSLSRVKDYFVFWPKPESSTLSNISRMSSFGVFLPFMTYGLVLSLFYVWRRRSMLATDEHGAALVLLYLFMLVYSGIHILSWTGIRYRLPVDAVLVVFAALALVHLMQAARVFSRSPAPAGLSSGTGAGSAGNPPAPSPQPPAPGP